MHKSEVKVVAHLHGGKLVKGFLKSAKTHDLEALFRHKLGGMESDIPIVSQESSAVVKLGVDSLKALFFVKSFEGSADYNEVKFFQSNPTVEGLWVQIKFGHQVTSQAFDLGVRATTGRCPRCRCYRGCFQDWLLERRGVMTAPAVRRSRQRRYV